MLRRGEALEAGLVLALFEAGLGSGPSWQALVLAGWRNSIVNLLWPSPCPSLVRLAGSGSGLPGLVPAPGLAWPGAAGTAMSESCLWD